MEAVDTPTEAEATSLICLVEAVMHLAVIF
jgi:hypothetical protein